MAKVNSCFKGVFIFFNVVFGIAGGVLLALGILAHAFYHETEEFSSMMVGMVFLYVLGGLTMLISVLGVYGACKEKKWALIVFCTGMTLGFCGLLRAGIPMMIARPEVKSLMESQLHAYLPLDSAGPDVKNAAVMFQSELKCCGLFNGHRDWGRHIPDSCLCPENYQETDRCEAVDSSRLEGAVKPESLLDLFNSDPALVYKEPCFPIIEKYMDKVFDTSLGIIFGFAFMALIGVMMSLVMIWYIKGHHIPTPAIFSVNTGPPKYSELYNVS